MTKDDVIAELRRIADQVGTRELSIREFKRHARMSVTSVCGKFGSWNEAILAAGLSPIAPGPQKHPAKIPDEDLLQEIIRVTGDLGKVPSFDQLKARGRFSAWPYVQRWGTVDAARKAAYARYGFPGAISGRPSTERVEPTSSIAPRPRSAAPILVPTTHKPDNLKSRKKVQFGEPIDFRGLRFAPVNEQGVVYVFGMVSRELGFLIESIRTEYPDCEGKRCVDARNQRWEHVRIEFEYKSGNFQDHGHRAEDCDLVVCWIHDWKECPVEVLELRSQLKGLSSS